MPPLACPLCNAPDFPPIGHYGEGIIPEGTETIDILGHSQYSKVRLVSGITHRHTGVNAKGKGMVPDGVK
tara:strand:- start:1633 stop:1842 length:210 start_codon:yes stop_codon:yes gene_type:complete